MKLKKINNVMDLIIAIGSLIVAILYLFSDSSLTQRITLSITYVCISAMWLIIFYLNNKSSNDDDQDNLKVKIKYFTNKIDKLDYIEGAKSDWIDLRAAEDVTLKAGEFKLINLGVAMELPEGYEAHMVPRSSTYKNFGIIQTNHCAIIDRSYCGDQDIWRYPAYALRDTEIHVNDRIAQFRIIKKQPEFDFVTVEKLGNPNRGGIGSTGTN